MRKAGRRSLTILLGLACLFAGSAGTARAEGSEPILVFAAASLKNALDEVVADYARDPVVVSYAASSALARQIEQGAPAHLLISADLDWMDYLDGKGLLTSGTRVNLLGNELVLVASPDTAPGGIELGPALDLSGLLGDGRLAIADVRAVPAGKYAKAALQSLGLWPSVQDRLAQAENVRAALTLVSRGEAPLGIVYRTDAAVEPRVRVSATFPKGSHPPIVYPAALTAGAPARAAAFLAHLQGSAAARSAFRRNGFILLDQPAS